VRLARVTEIAAHPRWPGVARPEPNDRAFDLAQGERVYQRILERAMAARRERFRMALERGHSIEEIAALTGLLTAEVAAVLSQ
jgi:DNA-directed RNA polymerase specialized sigma24 family protein